MKKISYLNVIRVIAFAAIIYYHIIMELIARDYTSIEEAHSLYYTANFHVATCAVALFFMVSGASLFLSSERKKKFVLKEYYKNRFLRILIPYYVATIIYVGAAYRFQLPGELDKSKLILNVFAMDGYASVLGFDSIYLMVGEWFMGCLMLIYLVYPILRILVVKWPMKTFLVATIGYIVLVIFYPFQINAYQNVLVKGYEFMLGMFIIRIYDRIPKKALFATIPFIILLFVCPVALPVKESFLITGIAAAIFISLSKLETRLQKLVRFNKVIGTICKFSYDVFLIHHAVIFVIFSSDYAKYGADANVPLMILKSLAVIVIAGLVVHYISKGIVYLIQRPFQRKKHMA